MKKIFCLLVTAALFAAVVVSCGDKPVLVTEVKLNKTSLELSVSDFDFLIATVLPDDADDKAVSWASSDEDVATVTDGKVTAIAEGEATITVTTVDGNHKANCKVTVFPLHQGETEMAFVEGGTFMMGATDEEIASEEAYEWEGPAHQVKLSSFKIAKTPVTQGQWKSLMPTNPSVNKGDNLPVENITRAEVLEYIKKLNEATGKDYRLPTEAEWEFAARGGKESKGYKYSGSNNVDEVAWYSVNSNSKTQLMSKKLPNELGIYDMSGNVSEFCKDWYGPYANAEQVDPQGPSIGSGYVIRGGSYASIASACRATYRASWAPTPGSERAGFIGFRLVHSY